MCYQLLIFESHCASADNCQYRVIQQRILSSDNNVQSFEIEFNILSMYVCNVQSQK